MRRVGGSGEGRGRRADSDRQVSIFYVYLGAACLPLNVVENQTTVGRLCRPEPVNATGHSWRSGVNIATKQPRHSRAAAIATHNNFVCDFVELHVISVP